MKFEIQRCGTQFCWRLVDKAGNVLCKGDKHRRQRAQVEEDVLKVMDGIPSAEIVDSTRVAVAEAANGHKHAAH